jgi:hypothetical protein
VLDDYARSLEKALRNTAGQSLAAALRNGIVKGDIEKSFVETHFGEDGEGMSGAVRELMIALLEPLGEFIPGAINTAIKRLDGSNKNYADQLMRVTDTFGKVNEDVAQELADFTMNTSLTGAAFVEKLQNLGSALSALDDRGDLELMGEITGFGRQAENIQAYVQTANAVEEFNDSLLNQRELTEKTKKELVDFAEEIEGVERTAFFSLNTFRDYINSLDLTSESGREAAQEALKYADSVRFVSEQMTETRRAQESLNQQLADRRSLELELLDTYGRNAQALQRQLMGMTQEQAMLQIAINLRQEVAAAEQQAAQAESNLADIYRDQVSAAEDLASTWEGVTQTLRQAADDMFGIGIDTSRADFQSTLQRALSGDRAAFDELPDLAQAFSESERGQASTLAEARRSNAQIANGLNKAADFAEKQYLDQLSQKEIAERQLRSLEDQEMSLSEAKTAVQDTRRVLSQTQAASVQALDRLRVFMPTSIVTGLLEPLSPLGAIEANTAAMINSLNNLQMATVQETAVRSGSGSGGVQAFNEAFYLRQKRDQLNRTRFEGRSNWTVGQVEEAFREASLTPEEHFEIFGRNEGLSPAPGFADGGIASGPMSGYNATLHGTEAVIPLNGERIPLEVNNQEMIQELRDLRREVKQLKDNQEQSQYELVKFTKRNNRQFEQWDIDGLPPAREEL